MDILRLLSHERLGLDIIRTFPLLCVMGLIFDLSGLPGDILSLPAINGVDLFLHGVIYGVLAGAALFAIHPHAGRIQKKQTLIGVVLFCLLYGVSDEFHQSFTPFRTVSVWDVAADTAGGAIISGLWLWRNSR